MKTFTAILSLAVLLSAGSCILPATASAQEISVSIQLFYDQLSPYGSWVEYPNYGYVWIPDVDQGFSPYGTDGHWIFTDDGWTWVSDYSWGWAPFHYGRWDYDEYYGWLWVPNDEWGPAWVTWRRSEGYYGWAPMGPGISIELSFGSGYRVPNDRWIFVSDRYLTSPDINRYYVDRSTNVTIINNSTVINNTYVDNSRHITYVAGPAKDDVQRVVGTTIRPVAIRENDKPGQILSGDQLQIYRPRVQTSVDNSHKPAPSKVVSLKEVKPITERKPGNQRGLENPPVNGKPQSSPPPAAKPPEKTQKPPEVTPPEKNKGMEQSPQQPPARPSDKSGRGQKPPEVTPPEKNKGMEQSPQQPPARPSDKSGRGQKPPEVTPPEKTKGMEQSPQQPPARPSDKSGRGQQPPVVNPPEKRMGEQPQPPDIKGKAPQTRVGNPIDTSKYIRPQSKPKSGPGTKIQPPPNTKGKVRDAQPPKTNKKNQDSTGHRSQLPLR